MWIRTIRGSLSLLGGGSKRTKTRKPVRLQSTEGFILVLFTKSKFLGGVVGFDGAGLDDDRGVAALVILALVRNRPRDVATSEDGARDDDGHKQNLSHNGYCFSFDGAKVVQKNEATKKVTSRFK